MVCLHSITAKFLFVLTLGLMLFPAEGLPCGERADSQVKWGGGDQRVAISLIVNCDLEATVKIFDWSV